MIRINQGDFIEALVADEPNDGPDATGTVLRRRTLRVTKVIALRRFIAVDAEGREHEVWPMDDPRPADVEKIAAFGAQRAAGRIIRDPPICQLAEEIDALAGAVMTRTGRHGITRISLTPDVGLSFGIAPGTSVDVMTPAGLVEVFTDPTLPPGTIEMWSGEQTVRGTVASPATDDVIRGLEKLRNETRSPERAQRIDAAIARIQADEHELAKADLRTAAQERIITSYRENVVVKLRAALSEALDAWASVRDDSEPNWPTDPETQARIAELRKLTEGAAPAEACSALRQHVAEMPFGWHKGKLLTHRGATDADLIAWLEKLTRLVEGP